MLSSFHINSELFCDFHTINKTSVQSYKRNNVEWVFEMLKQNTVILFRREVLPCRWWPFPQTTWTGFGCTDPRSASGRLLQNQNMTESSAHEETIRIYRLISLVLHVCHYYSIICDARGAEALKDQQRALRRHDSQDRSYFNVNRSLFSRLCFKVKWENNQMEDLLHLNLLLLH